MADEVEIAVNQEKKRIVSDSKQRIFLLFNVEVNLTVESTGIQWVQLKGIKDDTECAKNYINALCNPEIRSRINVPVQFFQSISKYRDYVEKNMQAVVSFPSNKEAVVQGEELAVVMASSAIEERVKELRAEQNRLPEASSFQSDEQEKVQSAPVSQIDPSLKEFAIKLGYTEEVIQQVLKKQAGKEVDQNILLRELINVSSPSLLQKARNSETIIPTTSSAAVNPHRSEVVARGPPAAQLKVIPKSWIQEPSAQQWEQHHRTNYIDKQEEEPAFLYQQVIGDSAAVNTSSDLRHIVIDGSNVAMSHGNQNVFSCLGIKLCIEYFKQRGHTDITVFVPQWRKETPRPEAPIRNQEILLELEQQRHLVFTPSRKVNGRRIVCYDDRFIVKLADETEGIIVSNDNFRDLFKENPKWQDVIEQRILMYSFVNDRFMVPDDPLGRHGPNLDDFLRKGTVPHKRICPYLKRCTYGLRCRFYHPERDPNRKEYESKKLTDNSYRHRVKESPKGHMDNMGYSNPPPYPPVSHYPYGPHAGAAMNGQYLYEGMVRGGPMVSERQLKSPNQDNDSSIFDNLRSVFPDAGELISQVIQENPKANLDQLANIIATKI